MSGRRTRVPVVLQTSAADCGAACLTMILRAAGSRATLREVKDRVGDSRDGVSAWALVRAGRAYGLAVRGMSLAPGDLVRLPPVVAHWKFNHFVVVERLDRREVRLVDPALGRRRASREEFDSCFTGVALLMRPGPGFQPRSERPEPSYRRRFLRSVVVAYRRLWGQILLASVLLQALGLAVPVATELVVDAPVGQRPGVLHLVGAALLLAVVNQLVLSYLRALLLARLRARADTELTTDVVRHLLRLPFAFFRRRGAPDLVNRITSVATAREMISANVVPALLDGPLVLGYVVLVAVRDPVLGGILGASALAQATVLFAAHRTILELTQQQLHAQSDAQQFLVEAVKGVETLKATGLEDRATARWSVRFRRHVDATVRAGRASGLLEATLGALRTLAPAALIWVGAVRVAQGEVSLGTMLGIAALAGAALAPLASLSTGLLQLQRAGAHLERVVDIVAAEPEPVRRAAAGPATHRLAGRVDLHDVWFRHGPDSPWVLSGVDLRLSPGSTVALVGRSGSGKSTLARVVLGLDPPTLGEVRYDGIPAERLDPIAVRGQFGVVTQEPVLFTGSIRENIGLTRPDADTDEIIAAARLACVHDEIMRMPMRYETLLSDGGGLSGGQRQRVALARALLARPAIVVLDEATSQLDAVTEAEIHANVARLRQTRIVIAHRLSTVRHADLIVVLDRGRPVEAGTHEELIARRGEYARLVAHQTAEPGDVGVGGHRGG